MVALTWDALVDRKFETGVDHGVLYSQDETGAYPLGVAWNGLVTVTESPAGAEATPFYADNIKYLNLLSAETFAATIEAYTFPTAFEKHDGLGSDVDFPGLVVGQQSRPPFGLVYRTVHGNAAEGNDYGYKIHMVYGLVASPSEKAYNTIGESPEPVTFSWEVSSTPVPMTGFQPTSILVADSTVVGTTEMALLEAELFGDVSGSANLPLPDAVAALLNPA